MTSVIFGDLLRTIAREPASQRALRNCSKEVDGEVSIYIQFAKGGTCNLENILGDFPAVQWLRLHFQFRGCRLDP